MANYRDALKCGFDSLRYNHGLLTNNAIIEMFRVLKRTDEGFRAAPGIDFVQQDLGVTRQTAAKYLDQLADAGFVVKHQQGRNNYYVNAPLIDLFLRVSES